MVKAQARLLRTSKPGEDLDRCADFAAIDCGHGRFAMADGVGTGWFSGLWAETLVEQFVALPLISADPFEVRWWSAEAAWSFTDRRAPQLDTLNEVDRQSAESAGSHSTLLTLRFIDVEAERGTFEILAIGDSCAFVAPRAASSARAFPISAATDFTTVPDTVASHGLLGQPPARRKYGFIRAGGLIILATDAVSEWLLRWQERGLPTLRAAMDEIARLEEASWPAYVDAARADGMPRDDATALVIQMLTDDAVVGEQITVEPPFDEAIVALRQRRFDDAQAIHDVRAMAAAIGDPNLTSIVCDPAEIAVLREMADALDQVMLAVHRYVNRVDTSLELLGNVWARNAVMLADAPAAEKVRETLRRLGVLTEAVPGGIGGDG